MKARIMFVSPHSKKIGESYVLPRLVEYADREATKTPFYLFNVCGEWDDLKSSYGKYIIENPASWIVRLAPDIESYNPWLNYRIWLTFVSISIVIGLPIALKGHRDFIVTARMATSAAALAKYAINRNIRFVASMAGVPLPSFFRRISWPFLYRSFDRVVVPCGEMIPRLQILCNQPEHMFEVIPNAVLSESVIEQGPTFDLPPPNEGETFRVLVVGRLTRQKGIDLLIKSLAIIPFPVHLTLVGDGEDEEKLRELANEIGVSNALTFEGRLENPWSLADQNHLFIMPSRWEGPGHTIIEALSLGMPSVVSDCPFGPQESAGYGRYAIVVASESVQAIAEGIEQALMEYEALKVKAIKGAGLSDIYTAPNVSAKWQTLAESI